MKYNLTPTKTSEIIPLEHDEQVCLIHWAKINIKKYPQLDMLYAIPNAAKRSFKVAAMMKAEGLKAGMPDLGLPVPMGEYHGLFIEMKRRKGSTTSEEQKERITKLREYGNRVDVCKGWDAAKDVLIDYLQII